MVLHATNAGNDTILQCDANGILHINTKLNTNHTGSGDNHFATCDAQGRTYINSDLGIPINALTEGGANQSLRTDGNGSLRVDTDKYFGAVSILKDNATIASAGVYSNNTTGRKGQKVSIQIISNGGTTSWTCAINQSLDNTNWTNTTANINAVPAINQLVEIDIIAPYWSLVLDNTSGISANFTIKYV